MIATVETKFALEVCRSVSTFILTSEEESCDREVMPANSWGQSN
jgi:hypothetical protein